MSQHNPKRDLSLALATPPRDPFDAPAPPLARCGVGPVGSPKSKAARAEADRTARALVEVAFARTGATAVGAKIGLSRAVVRGWAEPGRLCLTVRDVLAAPRGFARDVLEAALLVVSEEVPDTLDGLEKLASRLLCAAADLHRLAEEAPTDATRRTILALLDHVEEIVRQIRRRVLGVKGQG